MGRFGIFLAVGALVVALGGCGDTAAFECPSPQQGGSGVIPESEAKIKELSGLLATGDRDNRIRLIITDLQRQYPQADDAAIVNYLVTAYCPVVDALGIGDDEKTQQVDQFSSQVFKILESQKSDG